MKLQTDNRKKDVVAKRKAEELAALQKRQRDIALRRKSTQIRENKDTLLKWVSEFTTACLEERDVNTKLQSEIAEKNLIEAEVKDLSKQFALTKIKIEKFEMILEDPDLHSEELGIQFRIEESKNDLEEFGEELEVLEEKLKFKQATILELSHKLANSEVDSIKSRSMTLDSVEDANFMISALFDEIINKASEIKNISRNILAKQAENDKLLRIVENGLSEREVLVKNYESLISKIRIECEDRIKELVDQLELRFNDTSTTEMERKEREFQISYSKLKSDYDSLLVKHTKYRSALFELKEKSSTSEFKSRPRSSTNSITSLARAREQAKKKKDIPAEEEEVKKPRSSHHTPVIKGKFSKSLTQNLTEDTV